MIKAKNLQHINSAEKRTYNSKFFVWYNQLPKGATYNSRTFRLAMKMPKELRLDDVLEEPTANHMKDVLTRDYVGYKRNVRYYIKKEEPFGKVMREKAMGITTEDTVKNEPETVSDTSNDIQVEAAAETIKEPEKDNKVIDIQTGYINKQIDLKKDIEEVCKEIKNKDKYYVSKDDPVNHPSHYTYGTIECIDYIEDKGFNFNLGNAVKYITRAGHKIDAVEDLKKAVFYLNHEIQRLESKRSAV